MHYSSRKLIICNASDFGRLSLGDFLKNICHFRVRSDVQVLVIARNELDSVLCWYQVAKSLSSELTAERTRDVDRDWINTLLTSYLFHKLPPYNISRVLDKFTSRLVPAGEVVVRQGERGDGCYIIKEGPAIASVEDEALPAPQVLA